MSVGVVNKQTGDRIPTAGMPAIDNALDLTSVNPVQNAIVTAALANKQDKTDNSLQTTDKTVVGAINEHEGDISSLMSGLTNLTDAVGWDNHKNLLPMTLSHIKAINTDGTWSGNVYSVNGIDYTISLDSNGAINKITANGTAQYDAHLVLADNAVLYKLSGKNIVLNGATGGSTDTYLIQAAGYNGINSTASINGDSANFTPTIAFNEVRIIVTGGKTVTNVDFYPMLRLVGANATFDVYHPVIGLAVEALLSRASVLTMQVLNRDVISVAKSLGNGVMFYASSNSPANQPQGHEWGSYIFFKHELLCDIIYIDSTVIAVAYRVDLSTAQSLTWKTIALS